MAGVSSRTRSKNVPLFSSFSLDGSSSSKSKRRKSDIEDDTGLDSVSSKTCSKNVTLFGVSSRTRSRNVPLFGCLSLDGSSKRRKSDEDDKGLDCVTKKRKVNEELFVVPKNAKVISVDEDDDDEGSEQCDEKNFEGCVDAKDRNFIDEKRGLTRDNPITIGLHEYGESVEEEHSIDSDDADDEGDDDDVKDKIFVDLDDSDESEDDDSDESEENESSDEDFKVDELNEISDNDDDSSSDSPYVDEKEEEEEEKGYTKEFTFVEKLVREVKDKKYGISERTNEGVDVESHASVSSSTYEKKGSSSSKLKAKSVEVKVKNVSDESVNVGVNAKSKENVGDSDEGKDQYVKGLDVGGVSSVKKKQEKKKESDKQKMMESKGMDYKVGAKILNCGKKANNGLNQRGKSTFFMPKESGLLELLDKCLWDDKNTVKNDSIVLEVKDDDVDQQDMRKPPACVKTPHERIWSLKKVEKVQKTKEEEEQETLWDQMDISLREEDAVSMIGNIGTNEASNIKNGCPSSHCEHDDTYFNEEIGIYCKLCDVVVTVIKDISPLVDDRFRNEGSGQRASFDDSVNSSLFHGSQFNVSDGDSDANFTRKQGTVWDLIPGVKQTLYLHQQEGFEFIWKNLAGNTNLRKLKNAVPCREGGCIISHAPGTGKTRLTIVFLMAYLKVFPKCLPVIVAPANLLRTWEDEFKKWDIGVPFHNLNNPELSGKEHDDAVNLLNWSNARHSMDTTRMVKLISWYKEKSILGISYSLYEKLAGGGRESEDEGGEDEKKKKQASMEKRKEIMGNVLREIPGLLVLDEGHTPRNKKSGIWQVLSEVQTRKRIILSGTPFQNNFMELYNTLSLVKPSFPNTIPHELKKFCHKQDHKKASKEWIREPVPEDKIKQLKLLMDPFVHVHKGAVLQKKLPGLRNCVLRLMPDRFHKKILERIQSSQNTLIFEGKETRASVHPSLLLLESELLEEEESVLNKERLEKLRLNPYAGVKTKFLVEFVRLCAAINEKVLVFGQYLSPLRLIIDQLLNSSLKWTMDKEILYMYGEVKDRQSLIDRFNDENSQAKILLASTKSCSEGISLVGASRVVLLDVVWNPSVEKQAISRAYRIGQKRVVYTYHLLTEGTRECDKFCKQAEKDRLSELVFSAKKEDNNDELRSRAANIEDRILDKMIRHEKLKDMFVECLVQPKELEFESFGY